VIPKHRKVENIREIFLRAALQVTVIYGKHDVTLKHEVLAVLEWHNWIINVLRTVLIYYDLSVCGVMQFGLKKIKVTLCQWWANYGPRARCGPLRGSIRPAADFKI